MAADKYTRASSASITTLMLTIGIIVSVNVLGVFLWGRLDFTENERFTLSEASRQIVSGIDSELHITAYITEDMPPPTLDLYLRDILAEYEAAGDGRVTVSYVTPDEDEEIEEAQRAGIAMQTAQTLSNDSFEVTQGMRGLVFDYLDGQEALNIQQTDSAGLEYEITTKIMELVQEPIKIGIVAGHGSPSMGQELQALQEWLPLYQVSETNLAEEIPADVRALLIIAPTEEFSDPELHRLNQFVMNGGSLGVFGGHLTVSLDQQSMQQGQLNVQRTTSGLNRLLSAWGVEFADALVLDQRCRQEQVPVMTRQGFPAIVRLPWLAWPIAALDEQQQEHPVTFRVDAAQLMFTAGIRPTEVDGGRVEVTSLIRSSETSALVEVPEGGLNAHPNELRTFPEVVDDGPHDLFVALQGELPSAFPTTGVSSESGGDQGETESSVEAPQVSNGEGRVLVMGTGLPFLIIPPRNRARMADPSLLALVMNSIDWLGQEASLAAVRAKSLDDPPLDILTPLREAQVEEREAELAAETAQTGAEAADANEAIDEARARREAAEARLDRKKNLAKFGNMIGIPFLLAIFGVVRWRMRRAQKRA